MAKKIEMENNFFCQQKCGEENFSIDEWNKSYAEINAMPISKEEKQKLINGDTCKNQCFDCIAIVGETRIKNQKIRDEQSNKRTV